MADVRLCRLGELSDPVSARADIDEIFFEASGTKTFADEHARATFHERWLGRYITRFPQWFCVAHVGGAGASSNERVVGYIAGCLADPRGSPVFSDISYFGAFAGHLERYRGHLHVNLAEPFRGMGIGGRLIDAFVADAAAAGVNGVHVVTGRASRNVSFYTRCGFCEIDATGAGDGEIVFLGKRVAL